MEKEENEEADSTTPLPLSSAAAPQSAAMADWLSGP